MQRPAGYFSCDQLRDFDRRAADHGLPTSVLMENAGRGAAETLLALGVHGPVVVCCGKGNNGGDGLVIARYLRLAGVEVSVLVFAGPKEIASETARNLRAVWLSRIKHDLRPNPDDSHLLTEIVRAEWLVDALLGTGLTGPAKPPLDRVIAAMNASPARIFAVDIPSGLHGDTGEPLGPTIRARHTATFVAPKLGFANPAAATWIGKVHVIDIGVPVELEWMP